MAAGGDVLNTSGTVDVQPISGVYNLTNGCNARLRAKHDCLNLVTNASIVPQALQDMTQCPAHVDIVKVNTGFLNRIDVLVYDCFDSRPIQFDLNTRIVSVSWKFREEASKREIDR